MNGIITFTVGVAFLLFGSASLAFQATGPRPSRSTPPLVMAKGFNSAKNKQAALAQKMKEAKEQQKETRIFDHENLKEDSVNSKSIDKNDDMQAEFSRLLAKNLPPKPVEKKMPEPAFLPKPERNMNKDASNGPKVKARDLKRKKKRQTEENAVATKFESSSPLPSTELLQIGDKARRCDFEKLIQPETKQPIGPIHAASLMPWVPPYLTDFLVVVADPRRQSKDLRTIAQYLMNDSLLSSLSAVVMVIGADEAHEMAAWRRRVGIRHDALTFVDPSLKWMKTYSCVDEDQWSSHILLIDSDAIIQMHFDKVDPSFASRMVLESIRDLRK